MAISVSFRWIRVFLCLTQSLEEVLCWAEQKKDLVAEVVCSDGTHPQSLAAISVVTCEHYIHIFKRRSYVESKQQLVVLSSCGKHKA